MMMTAMDDDNDNDNDDDDDGNDNDNHKSFCLFSKYPLLIIVSKGHRLKKQKLL